MAEVTSIEIQLKSARQAATDADRLDSSLSRLGRTGTNAEGVFNKLSRSTGSIRGSFDRLKQSVFSIEGAFAAIGVTAFARELVDANLRLERMQNSLRFATGSAELAGDALEFVRTEANRLGLEAATAGQAFAGIAAAARGTSLEGAAVREVFLGVAEAGAALTLSANDMEGVLLAVQQMMSKGTVSAEELRGQIGERLPGAYGLAADAVGVTTEELGKMLEKGEVIAEDFLPKFAAEMRKSFGGDAAKAAQGLQGDINRLKNAYDDFLIAVGDTGLIDAFGRAVELLSPLFVGLARDIGDTITIIDRFLQKIGLVELKSVEVKLQNAGDKVVDLSSEIVNLTQKQDRLLKQAAQDLGTTVEDLRRQLESGFSEPLLQSFFGEGAIELQNQINQARSALNQAQSDYLGLSDTLVEVQKNSEATNESLGKVGTGPSDALVALRAQLDKVSAATTQYNERINLLKKELAAGNIEQSEFNKLAGLAKGELDKVLKGTNAAAKSTKAYADEQARLNNELTAAVESLDPLVRAANDYNRTVKTLSSDLAKAELGQDRVNELLAKAKGEFLETAENIDKATDASQRLVDEGINPMEEAFERSFERLDNVAADFWRNLFEGGKFSFDSLKSLAVQTMAEIAHSLTTKKFTTALSSGLSDGTLMNWIGGYFGGTPTPASLSTPNLTPQAAAGSPPGVPGQGIDWMAMGKAMLPFAMQQVSMHGSAFLADKLGGNADVARQVGAWTGILPGTIAGLIAGSNKSKIRLGTSQGTGNFEDSAFATSAFGNIGLVADRTKRVDAAEFKPFFDSIAQIDNVLAESSAPEKINEVRAALEGFMSSKLTSSDAFRPEQLERLIRERLDVIFTTIEGDMSRLARSFRDLPLERMMEGFSALNQVSRFVDSRPLEDFGKALEQNNRTLQEATRASRNALLELVNVFDGSLDATKQLAGATQARYTLELQLLGQIENVSRGITSSFESTRETIIRAGLSQEQLFDRVASQAEGLIPQLMKATDPQRIGEIAGRIDRLIGESFRMLNPEQQQIAQPGFLAFQGRAESIAQGRLEDTRQVAVRENNELRQVIRSELGLATKDIREAAQMDVEASRNNLEAARLQVGAANSQQDAARRREYHAGMGGR